MTTPDPNPAATNGHVPDDDDPPTYAVFTGPLPDVEATETAPADAAEATPRHSWRQLWTSRRVRLVVLAVVPLVMCGAYAPVAWFVYPLLKGTIEAGKGQQSPGSALLAFALTFNNSDDVGVDPLIVPASRPALRQQRRDYRDQMARDARITGWSGQFESASAPQGQPDDQADIRGDRASVAAWYSVRWTPPPSAQADTTGGYSSTARLWRAQTSHDRDGWRLISVDIPPWCGGYSRCPSAPPQASPSQASPSLSSPSTDDLLGDLRSKLPCAPGDPLRSMRACPSTR